MSASPDAIEAFTQAARGLLASDKKSHPFDDVRELRAWSLDRAVQMRGFLIDGKEIEQLLAHADTIKAYIETGERPAGDA